MNCPTIICFNLFKNEWFKSQLLHFNGISDRLNHAVVNLQKLGFQILEDQVMVLRDAIKHLFVVKQKIDASSGVSGLHLLHVPAYGHLIDWFRGKNCNNCPADDARSQQLQRPPPLAVLGMAARPFTQQTRAPWNGARSTEMPICLSYTFDMSFELVGEIFGHKDRNAWCPKPRLLYLLSYPREKNISGVIIVSLDQGLRKCYGHEEVWWFQRILDVQTICKNSDDLKQRCVFNTSLIALKFLNHN